jgi:hypothetical protein
MALEAHVPQIAGVIQLSIAPVFMLTAIGSFLAVITQRLARAVDRARELEDRVGGLPADSESLTLAKEELYVLSLRALWTNRAITSCIACGLLVCFLIATLFAGAFLDTDVSRVTSGLFVMALIALTIGLVSFLREIYLATRYLRIGTYRPGF